MGRHEVFTGRNARLVALAEAIEQSPDFNMRTWAQCIAAHAVRLFPEMEPLDELLTTPDDDYYARAAERLALDPHERRRLMLPQAHEVGQPGGDADLGAIDRQWAADTLRDFAHTGKVDWLKNKSRELVET